MRPGYLSKRAYPRQQKIAQAPSPKITLKTATIKGFDGGWDASTNEISLSTKYSRVMENISLGSDGTVQLRFGCSLFTDVANANMSTIVGSEYFATFLCVVDDQGRVALIDGTGSITVVWDGFVADARGVPRWNPTEYVSFTQMRNQLIIASGNGLDKPIVVQANKSCNYLLDLGTLKNTNVPVCKFVFSNQRFLILAGNPSFPSRIYIGSRDTVGTFFGDPPPNDSVNYDLDTYINGDPVITGINAFREFLVIGFPNACIVAKLGVYNGTQHTPAFDDPLQEIGVVAHKTMAFLGDDLFSLDVTGVQSLNRVFVTNKLHPTSMSDRIQPEIVKAIKKTTIFDNVGSSPFGIFHHSQNTYLLFVPNEEHLEAITETRCFSLLYTPESKISAWADYRGWNWRSVCKTLLNDVFFSRGTEIFLYGRDENPIYGDFVGSEETWDDGFAWSDGRGWTPVADPTSDPGMPIRFAWELPWTDFNQRMNKKQTHFLHIDCSGDGGFTAMMFVDNFYRAWDFGEPWQDGTMFDDDLGWERNRAILQPHIQIDMVGGDSEGYGLAPYGSGAFGGGRLASDERLYEFPSEGRLHKLRIEGESNRPLSFKSISLAYSRGSIGR